MRRKKGGRASNGKDKPTSWRGDERGDERLAPLPAPTAASPFRPACSPLPLARSLTPPLHHSLSPRPRSHALPAPPAPHRDLLLRDEDGRVLAAQRHAREATRLGRLERVLCGEEETREVRSRGKKKGGKGEGGRGETRRPRDRAAPAGARRRGRTHLVQPALGAEDGDVPVVAGAAAARHDAQIRARRRSQRRARGDRAREQGRGGEARIAKRSGSSGGEGEGPVATPITASTRLSTPGARQRSARARATARLAPRSQAPRARRARGRGPLLAWPRRGASARTGGGRPESRSAIATQRDPRRGRAARAHRPAIGPLRAAATEAIAMPARAGL